MARACLPWIWRMGRFAPRLAAATASGMSVPPSAIASPSSRVIPSLPDPFRLVEGDVFRLFDRVPIPRPDAGAPEHASAVRARGVRWAWISGDVLRPGTARDHRDEGDRSREGVGLIARPVPCHGAAVGGERAAP